MRLIIKNSTFFGNHIILFLKDQDQRQDHVPKTYRIFKWNIYSEQAIADKDRILKSISL